MELSSEKREKKIAEVTLVGSVVNLVLSVGKIAAGLFGRSAAMVTDGIHSLSDLFSDIIVLVFYKAQIILQDALSAHRRYKRHFQ